LAKIKSQINRFFLRNLHHFQETLFALTLVFVIGGFAFTNIGEGGAQLKAFLAGNNEAKAELLASSTLALPEDKYFPENSVNFSEADITNWGNSNQGLIKNVFEDSLIDRFFTVAKHIAGGVFILFLSLYIINFLSSADKAEASKKFSERMIWAFTGFLIFAIAQPLSHAFILLGDKDGSQISLLTNPETVLASANLIGFTYRSAAHLIQYILGGVALITMGASIFQMVGSVGDEETVKNSRRSLAWAAIALVMVGASALVVDKIFAPDAVIEAQIASGQNPAIQLKAILESGQSQARIIVLNYVKYYN
jgi:hypothetical protein